MGVFFLVKFQIWESGGLKMNPGIELCEGILVTLMWILGVWSYGMSGKWKVKSVEI